ncbi:hypothetical protein GLOTRDRAFT_109240 [Gloeophyllum trabeum ATCC 11539]|uniref:Uncharacterized protein n=1 Tax=Gloeophyllum trabeum (strain ATCC 11539 / FP-39264 / Madison 617) TaxID=670483 RepID=S7S4X3_GLOTA|nr:uncharacterized protein GLOTRDRAFT_109240 [Gloeophyllum trabeum ATCC 11539]EPQ60974.1 hypothetical protein GLOTRDRAFT_109240 [Gloeophyllum trabeum ATCC 11539]
MKALLAASWRVAEQLPPPSLREILGAYNARGDGDREMLLAMLNAKSAEDQRLAAVATLQRTMLEMYRASSLAGAPTHPYPLENYHFPPPMPSASPPLHERGPSRCNGEPNRLNPSNLPGIREATSMASERPRKRARSSRTSRSPQSQQLDSLPDLPPSPYSSSHSDAAERSPRSRGSMAIGSLLSGGKGPLRTKKETDEAPLERNQSRRECEPREEWPSRPTPVPATPTMGTLAA